jgi:cytosine/adenosine deaminase-related metal-dependent hydrolase
MSGIGEPELLAIDEPTSPPIVVRGKVVTMTAPENVIAAGAVYLNKGEIVEVRAAGDPAPAGFETAPVFDTQGTIYPGLLDLHNHLAYNVATLWNPPRKFQHRNQWRDNTDYARRVKKPLELITRPGSPTAPAVVRYVEVKALLGGTTSVQGMRSRFQTLSPYYSGLVRNFESSGGDPRLPSAGSRIVDLEPDAKPEEIEAFRRGLSTNQAYVYHLSEGFGTETRAYYLALKQNELLQESLVAVHALALRKADFKHLVNKGCKVVWSPLSNQLLYGRTLDTNRLVDVPFTLGADWSPSGSKNLLEELKAAWLTAQDDGSSLRPYDLTAAATRHAARAIGWGDALGTLEAGKYADLLVLETRRDDPYENLLHATERDVRLVVIAGVPRYGERSLLARYGPSDGKREDLLVGGREKALYLFHPKSRLNDLGFAPAKARLDAALSDLPALQQELDAAPFDLAAAGDDGGLLLDNDPPVIEGEAELLAAVELLPSIPLDSPTVVDDPQHFDRVEAVAHLPAALRGLRDFYQ